MEKLEKIAEVLGVELQQLLNLNERNMFNIIENSSPLGSNNCNIYLTETQCVHELEKSRLLLQERDKEVNYLKREIEHLNERIALLENNRTL